MEQELANLLSKIAEDDGYTVEEQGRNVYINHTGEKYPVAHFDSLSEYKHFLRAVARGIGELGTPIKVDKLKEFAYAFSMAMSIIAYGYKEGQTPADIASDKYMSQDISFKLKCIAVEEVIDGLDHITKNVGTDSEGITYNSIKLTDI